MQYIICTYVHTVHNARNIHMHKNNTLQINTTSRKSNYSDNTFYFYLFLYNSNPTMKQLWQLLIFELVLSPHEEYINDTIIMKMILKSPCGWHLVTQIFM